MPNKAKLLKRKDTPNVGLVARPTTQRNDVGKVPVRILNLSAPGPRIRLITILTQKPQNLIITQHRPTPSLHPRKTNQQTSFATTTPIRPTSLYPTIHQIGPSNANFPQSKTTIDGLSFCCLAAADGKAIIITHNNTQLFQKPIPVWDPDYTTNLVHPPGSGPFP